jgi:hypothetical protein
VLARLRVGLGWRAELRPCSYCLLLLLYFNNSFISPVDYDIFTPPRSADLPVRGESYSLCTKNARGLRRRAVSLTGDIDDRRSVMRDKASEIGRQFLFSLSSYFL